jgi:hypothetical protein
MARTISGVRKLTVDLKLGSGQKVDITKLEPTIGWLIKDKNMKTRRVGPGQIINYVPGHGGDVWFVRNEPENTVAAYAINEFKVVEEWEHLKCKCGKTVYLFKGGYICERCGAEYNEKKERVGYVCMECQESVTWVNHLRRGLARLWFCNDCLKKEIGEIESEMDELDKYLTNLKAAE